MGIKYEKGTFTTVPNIKKLKGEKAGIQALFLWICIYSDENGECFPARSRLARDLKVSVKTIDRYLERLVDLKLVTKRERWDKEKNKNLTNVYQIMIIGDEGVGTNETLGTNQLLGVGTNETLGVGTNQPHITKPILTKSNLTMSKKDSDPMEVEVNRVIGLFSELNKDWKTFFQPGAQRTSARKLIDFAKADGLDIELLIKTAKEAQSVEYAPQIFNPVDMVSRYSKLIAYMKKASKFTPMEQYAIECVKKWPLDESDNAMFMFARKYSDADLLSVRHIIKL